MANPSKKKGSKFETDVVGYFNDNGFPHVERRTLRGNKDCGDIAGLPEWVLELKATKGIELGATLTEAKKEAENAGVHKYAAIHKRRQANVRDSFVTLPLWLFVSMLQEQRAPVRVVYQDQSDTGFDPNSEYPKWH